MSHRQTAACSNNTPSLQCPTNHWLFPMSDCTSSATVEQRVHTLSSTRPGLMKWQLCEQSTFSKCVSPQRFWVSHGHQPRRVPGGRPVRPPARHLQPRLLCGETPTRESRRLPGAGDEQHQPPHRPAGRRVFTTAGGRRTQDPHRGQRRLFPLL